MKHTPGPWHYAPAEDESGEQDVKSGEWFVAVCCMQPGDGDPEANARLIAAAPELLEALKDATCALEVCGRNFDYVMDKARAAIAKATGESA